MPEEQWSLEQGFREADDEQALNAGNELNVEYDHAKRVLNLAGRTGLPWEIIDSNPDAVQEAVDKGEFNAKEWMDESPEFAAFAAKNPMHLAVLKKDRENMSAFERFWKPYQYAGRSAYSQVELNRINARRAKGTEFQYDGDEERMEELRSHIQTHNFGAGGTFRPVIWAARELGPTVYTLKGAGEGAMVGGMAGASAGAAYGAVGGTFVAPGGGTAVGAGAGAVAGFGYGTTAGGWIGGADASFEMMRGEQYGRYIEAGFGHTEAANMSLLTGSISTLPELAGIGRITKHIPGVEKMLNWGTEKTAALVATDILVKPTVRQATGRLIGRYGVNMGVEISTEIFQDSIATLGQNYLAAGYDRPEAHVSLEQWQDDMAETIVQTAKGVMLIGGIGPGAGYMRDLRRAKRSEEMEQTFRALADNINKSTTRTEAPETYRDFVESVTKNNGQVLIDAKRWDEFWQDNNEDPDAMAERFGMDAETMDAARENGHDVEIPIVAFAEQLAPSKLFDGILQDLKFHENDMSPRERSVFDANKPSIIRDIEASLDKLQEAESEVEADQIMQEVGNQLIEAQFQEDTASHLAQLYRGFGVIADRMDMDATDLFEKFFGGVRRVTKDALSRSEVLDPGIDPILNRLRRDDFPTERQQRGPSLMDFVDESGGLDPMDPELASRDFELGAMDLGISKAKMNRWKDGGKLLSDIAETAFEAGFIAENDENLLLEALDRELGGESVFGTRDLGDPAMQEIAASMDMAGRMIDQLGIDLNEMSNEEVRGVLEAADTYDQEMTGEELRMMIEALNRATEKAGGSASEIDTLLGRAEMLMPLVYQDQDFGGVQLTDTVTVVEDTGESNVVQISEDAQVKFERAQRRQKALKALKDCVSG